MKSFYFIHFCLTLAVIAPTICAAENPAVECLLSELRNSNTTEVRSLPLISEHDAILRLQCHPIPTETIADPTFQKFLDSMIHTQTLKQGVGLAAPQVGKPIRAIVVENEVFINPHIESYSRDKTSNSEGCLSLPNQRVWVERSKSIEVTWTDRQGHIQHKTFTGRKAVIIQHEVDHLNGRLIIDHSAGTSLVPEMRKYNSKISEISSQLSEVDRSRLKSYEAKIVNSIFTDLAKNPFSRIHEISDPARLAELIGILAREPSDAASKLNGWIQNENDAVVALKLIEKTDYERLFPVLRMVAQSNPHLKGVKFNSKANTGLVSYSFEKESSSPAIVDMYKDPKISDDDWSFLPVDFRMKILKKLASTDPKKARPATVIAGTAHKPKFTGGYAQELNSSHYNKDMWEIASRDFEINLDTTFKQVKEIAAKTKETHSFHVHMVFDLPQNYPHFQKFTQWVKQVNDYLTLRGIEEGLHPSELSGIVEPGKPQNFRALFSVRHRLPTNLNQVGFQNFKFFSMGIRGNIYSDAPINGYKRIGLELRDVSRDLDLFEIYADKISDSIKNRDWENHDLDHAPLWLDPHSPTLKSNLEQAVGRDFAKLYTKANQSVLLPLEHFESLKGVSPEAQSRIEAARKEYVSELIDLKNEILRMRAKKDDPPLDLIDAGIKMTIATWAKKAKVAQYFEGF